MLDLFLSKIHVSGWCMAPRIENFLENPVEEQDTCRFSIKGLMLKKSQAFHRKQLTQHEKNLVKLWVVTYNTYHWEFPEVFIFPLFR